MISVIICSISPTRLQKVSQSIHNTIGVEHEIIAIDNRQKKWSIAKVYNEGARQANYPYLFFVHEDVVFHNTDWGTCIEQKLSEPDCGVIGFAGGRMLPRSYSGWGQYGEDMNSIFYFFARDGVTTRLEMFNTSLNEPFTPVVALDGFAMFVKKAVWQEFPFDEQMLTGFHCYDIDFSLQIATKYTNYVCAFKVWVEHLSGGNFGSAWVEDTIRLYHQKWKHLLPVMAPGLQITNRQYQRGQEWTFYYFLFKALRTDVSKRVKRQLLKEFWCFPFSWRHLSHCLSCTVKYLRS